MTVDELVGRLKWLERAGKIQGDTLIEVRDPEVSEPAMDAGSYGYVEVVDVLVTPSSIILLRES